MKVSEPLVAVDVAALLDRIDEVCGRPEGLPRRDGAWLVDRWWRLRVVVIPDFVPDKRGGWRAGISISCIDPAERFATSNMTVFEQCRLTMQVYTHVELADQTAAIAALPGPTPTSPSPT